MINFGRHENPRFKNTIPIYVISILYTIVNEVN